MRTVVITGASRGLGLASASLLHRRGWRVVAAMRSVDEGLMRLRRETAAAADDTRLLGVRLDLGDLPSIGEAARRIESLVGVPHAVVHNAGIAAAGSVEETPLEVWQRLFATNLFGPVALTRALLPGMRAAGRGRFVFVSSQVAIRGMPAVAPYSASKSAVQRWGEALAAEIAPFGLGVTVLVTGAFKTGILTEEGTPDCGDHDGPYAPHYRGIRAAGGAMVDKAGIPAQFAEAMARAVEDDAPYSHRTVGSDAFALSLLARLLSARQLRSVLGRVMRMPADGALRGMQSRDPRDSERAAQK